CKHGDFPVVSVPTPIVAAGVASQCSAGNGVGIAATVQNKAPLTTTYMDQTGLDSVDYTVLLVQTDTGQITGDGALLQFTADTPTETVNAKSSACFSVPSTRSAAYEVRAISVTGAVVTTAPVTVLAAHPSSSQTSTAAATSSAPASPTPTGKPTGSPSATAPAATGSAATSSAANPVGSANPIGSGGANVPGSNGTGPSANPGFVDSGQAINEPGGSTDGGPQTAPVGSRGGPSSSPSASSASPAPAPSPSPSGQSVTAIPLAEPPIDAGSGIFNWQSGPAVIVLAVALAISALVGSVLWSAKRR
ncbi:MAG: hypothetical protein JWO63_3270, partial [Frankiales bacterium]|nr:hypothetical protein [Frankiales bacterium]